MSPSSKASLDQNTEAITASLCHKEGKIIISWISSVLGLSSLGAAPRSVCAALTGEKMALFYSLYREENWCPL